MGEAELGVTRQGSKFNEIVINSTNPESSYRLLNSRLRLRQKSQLTDVKATSGKPELLNSLYESHQPSIL